MRLKNNETKKVKNWNDSCLNIYTRNNNSVIVDTIYRYAPSITKKMSYENFKKWQLEIEIT
tara:strand:+ start:2024 stop:2206 length:183 start_codon:yes stop_codon:yes gene_type:complete